MLLFRQALLLLQRRNGRAVECTGLENQRTARYRGFESLFLRNENPSNESWKGFLFVGHASMRSF